MYRPSHTYNHARPTHKKNKEFWSVCCDSLGVRQDSLIIRRERRMNVIHSLCASTSAHMVCMRENVSIVPRVNVDSRGRMHQPEVWTNLRGIARVNLKNDIPRMHHAGVNVARG